MKTVFWKLNFEILSRVRIIINGNYFGTGFLEIKFWKIFISKNFWLYGI